MSICAQFEKRYLINQSRQNAELHTYFVLVVSHFPFEMCGSLFPVCQTVTVNPNKFIEPAPFVLRTILSELDFQCPTCKHTVQLHQLPQHQEYCIQSPTTAPTHILTPSQRSVSVKPSPPCPSETHTWSTGKGTRTGKCTINTSRTYNHH